MKKLSKRDRELVNTIARLTGCSHVTPEMLAAAKKAAK